MHLNDVTPDWIRSRMKLMNLRQGKVAREIGLAPDKMSKSMKGKREFRREELDALARLLCEPEPPEADAETLAFARRIAALPPALRPLMESMLDTLEKQQLPQDARGTEGRDDDSQG